MQRKLKKPGGFPPKPPGKPKYDKDGCYTDDYSCYLVWYNSYYKTWEKELKPWEEVFGVPFKVIDEPDYEYLRKKKYGLLEPLEIEYDGNHPADEVFE